MTLAPPPVSRDRGSLRSRGALRRTAAVLIGLAFLFPFYYVLVTSLNSASQSSSLSEAAGRRIVWTEWIAAFLRLVGVEQALSVADVPAAELRAEPGRYVLMPDPDDLPSLLDLPVGDGYPVSRLVHANGEPLGPFEPRWAPFTDWLAALGIELRQIGCSGHASQDDLHHMLERMRPATVFPIHTTSPTRLHPPRGMRRVLAGYGTRYTFGGDQA